MSSEDVVVRFGGSIENLTAAVDSARGSIESLGAPFTGLTTALQGFGEAFAAAFAVREVANFAESMASLGTEATRASQILGVSTEEVGALKLVALAAGGSLEQLEHAFGMLSANVIEESDKTKRALAALGLGFSDIKKLTPIEQLELLADKFRELTDGEQKDAIAKALLGRAGVELIPILNLGAEGIKKFVAALRELEPGYKEGVAAGEELHLGIVLMNAAIQGASIEAFLSLKSALMGAVQGIQDLYSWFTNSVREGGAMASAMDLVAMDLRGLTAALAVATAAVKELVAAFSYLADVAGMALNSVIKQVGNLWQALLHLDFSDVKNEWAFFGDQIKQRTEAYTKDVTSANDGMFKELQTIFETGDKKLEDEAAKHRTNMAGAGKAAKPNTDALEAAKKEIEGEMKALQEGLNLKKTVWDGEVAAHKMSKEQEFASLMQATEKEYQAELALLEKEKALQWQKPAAVQEINNKIEQLQAAHELKMVKLDQEAIAESTASWERMFQMITTSFNSQLRGLITGTTSFSKAFKSMATDMVVKFIEVIEEMGVKYAAEQLGLTTVTVTGAQQRAAAELAAQTAGATASMANALRMISQGAGETFAGVFGFLSPVLGPAAAGPAMAAAGQVMTTGTAMASFEMGSWSLPADMVAQVHQGEMIVPAGPAAAMRGALSGGQGGGRAVNHTTQININSPDAAGVKRLFVDNDRALLKAIDRASRRGVHLGLSKLGTI